MAQEQPETMDDRSMTRPVNAPKNDARSKRRTKVQGAPHLSIIVPFYDVKNYFEECLDSIVEQDNFEKLEIILIDDGSRDGSADIALKYCKQHTNMKYIRQDNAGAGSARNKGLRHVTSQLVTFVDSDDRLPNDAYKWMLRQFRNPDVDLVIGKISRFPKPQEFIWDKEFSQGNRIIGDISQAPMLIHSAGPCNKIYRTSFIRKNKASFEENVHFEDAFFVIPLLLAARSIGIVCTTVYEYRQREEGGSIMDSLFNRQENFYDYLLLSQHLSRLFKTLSPSKTVLLEQFLIRGLQGFLTRADEVLGESALSYKLDLYDIVKTFENSSFVIACSNASHRIAYARLLDRMLEKDSVDRESVSIIDTKPVVGFVPHSSTNSLRYGGPMQIAFESIRRHHSKLIIEGRFTVKFAPLTVGPSASITLRVAGKSFTGKWVRRNDRKHHEGLYSGFKFLIRMNDWPSGIHTPHIFIGSKLGEFGARPIATLPYYRNSLSFVAGSSKFEFVAGTSNQVVVKKSAYIKRNSIPGLILDDMRAAYKKTPFAKLRILRLVTRAFMSKQIWIVGERWGSIQDNGFAFYQQLTSSKTQIKAYYLVSDKTDRSRFSDKSKLIKQDSLKHVFLMLHASVLINSHDVDTYTLPRQWKKSDYLRFLRPRTRTKRVFLQHGVIYRYVDRGQHRLVQGYDHIITSTPAESAYVAESLDYGKEIIQSGLPRFQGLVRSSPQQKYLLFAPTWRQYLVRPSYLTGSLSTPLDSFVSSRYLEEISSFLQNSRLLKFLSANGFKLVLLPHFEMDHLLRKELTLPSIVEFADLDTTSFQDYLRGASVFITDYSSTLFDTSYMRIPSIYYQFDKEDFDSLHSRPSYFDFTSHGYGPVVSTADDVVDCLENMALNNFQLADEYSTRVESDFVLPKQGVATAIVERILQIDKV